MSAQESSEFLPGLLRLIQPTSTFWTITLTVDEDSTPFPKFLAKLMNKGIPNTRYTFNFGIIREPHIGSTFWILAFHDYFCM